MACCNVNKQEIRNVPTATVLQSARVQWAWQSKECLVVQTSNLWLQNQQCNPGCTSGLTAPYACRTAELWPLTRGGNVGWERMTWRPFSFISQQFITCQWHQEPALRLLGLLSFCQKKKWQFFCYEKYPSVLYGSAFPVSSPLVSIVPLPVLLFLLVGPLPSLFWLLIPFVLMPYLWAFYSWALSTTVSTTPIQLGQPADILLPEVI